MKEIVFTTGLAYGEETKGNNVGFLTQKLKAHTNIRSGGCQAGHHFTCDDGLKQTFDLYGSGTFFGAETYLRDMVIDPVFLFREAIELESKGVKDPLKMIYVDQNCLSITPYHGALSRFKELTRGQNKKGTTGIGVGEAIRDSSNPNLTITVKDSFKGRDYLMEKIEAIRLHQLEQARKIYDSLSEKNNLPDQAYQELDLLNNTDLVADVADSLWYIKDLVRIVDQDYFNDLMIRDGNIVCESSHGALLHPQHGFTPYVTQVDPTSKELIDTVKNSEYSGKIVRLGISRCYFTRHGAGPLVSYSPELTQKIQESSDNNTCNEWLGEFRNGAYDLVAMRYAINLSGGKTSFSGLNISYLDVLPNFSQWPVCESYVLDKPKSLLEKFFYLDHRQHIIGIKLYHGRNLQNQLQHQDQLSQLLFQCQPEISYLRPTKDKKLDQIFMDYVEEKLELPVVVAAYGPKPSDRHFRTNLT